MTLSKATKLLRDKARVCKLAASYCKPDINDDIYLSGCCQYVGEAVSDTLDWLSHGDNDSYAEPSYGQTVYEEILVDLQKHLGEKEGSWTSNMSKKLPGCDTRKGQAARKALLELAQKHYASKAKGGRAYLKLGRSKAKPKTKKA